MSDAEIIAFVAERPRPAVSLRVRLGLYFESRVRDLEQKQLLDSYPTGDLFGPRVYRLGPAAVVT